MLLKFRNEVSVNFPTDLDVSGALLCFYLSLQSCDFIFGKRISLSVDSS